MSPVFRHGRLRLYLLKLLDEAPRHGYEVIRLLQDRFLGVYAPSPGTIYPRLARLEEEGLVTHDETDGKKVYRITDRGRAELRARMDDLAELEEELTASVRDIAREVSEDVRETVRNLREELASAARDMQGTTRTRAGGDAWQDQDAAQTAQEEAGRAKAGAGQAEGRQEQADDTWGRGGAWRGGDTWGQAADEAGRPHGGRSRGGWGDWIGGTGGPGWGGWPGAGGPHGQPGYRTFRDLERLARQFTRDLRAAAWHAQAVSEDTLGDLRDILDETLDRIKTEVFAGTAAPRRPADPTASPPPGTTSGPGTGAAAGTTSGPDAGGGPGPQAGGGAETDTEPHMGSAETN
jgi:DNA-binding PadR family transcriptional regulator